MSYPVNQQMNQNIKSVMKLLTKRLKRKHCVYKTEINALSHTIKYSNKICTTLWERIK